MQHYLTASTLISNTRKIIPVIAEQVKTSGCNIIESRFNLLGQELTIMLFLSGSWNEIARMEDLLRKLEKRLNITILMSRTQTPDLNGDAVPYAVDVVGVDHPGIILEITRFISSSNLTIQHLSSNTYQASQTGTKMFLLHMSINIPVGTSIAAIRGDFMDFCDRLNLDAIMEPVK